MTNKCTDEQDAICIFHSRFSTWYLFQKKRVLNQTCSSKIPANLGISDDYQRLSLLHNFIQRSMNPASAQGQILLAVCQRFAIVKISDSGSS